MQTLGNLWGDEAGRSLVMKQSFGIRTHKTEQRWMATSSNPSHMENDKCTLYAYNIGLHNLPLVQILEGS